MMRRIGETALGLVLLAAGIVAAGRAARGTRRRLTMEDRIALMFGEETRGRAA